MWEKMMIPKYRLCLHGLYGLYGLRCPLSPERSLSLITHSLTFLHRFHRLMFPIPPNFQIHSPDSKVHGANMGPTWVLSAPDGSHVGPMNLVIRVALRILLRVEETTNGSILSTHWGMNKMADIWIRHFQMNFLKTFLFFQFKFCSNMFVNVRKYKTRV